jgi:cardiolipin synthase
MIYHLYTTSSKAWTAMLSAINSAKHSIYIEMYIFLGDTKKSHDFIGRLIAKAQEGVRVIIVADALGSAELQSSAVKDLRAAGAEFFFFSHWLRRTHRKIIIIDKAIAFLGGVNIERKTRLWNDMTIMIRGRHIIHSLLHSFAYTYKMTGGKNKSLLADYRVPLSRKIKNLVLENLPTSGIRSLSDYYRDKIIGAQTSLQIVTPYFMPPRWLLALLDSAARRGVKIEIIIPADTDIRILNRINRYYLSPLLPVGVRFYASQRMNHAKMMIIDGQEGLIGSQNLDILSFGQNIETGVFFRQPDLVRDLAAVFEKWKKYCRPIQASQLQLQPLDYLLLFILKLIRPWF